jgi:N-acetyltransferase
MKLENEKVALVPFNAALHTEALHNYALQQPITWYYSLVSAGGSVEAMNTYIDFALQQQTKGNTVFFIVIDKATNAVAGSTRFYDIDETNKCATIGYTWYGEQYRRTGLNRNCKILLLDYAFSQWQMQRIEFRADINNNASIKAMKAIGCKEEGIIRSHGALANDTRRTSMVLSILKEEWENGGKELLQNKIH